MPPTTHPTAQQKAQQRALLKKQAAIKKKADKRLVKLSKKLDKLQLKRRKREEERRRNGGDVDMGDGGESGEEVFTPTTPPIFPPEILQRIISHLLPIHAHTIPIAPTHLTPHHTINSLLRLLRVSRSFASIVKPYFFAHLRVTSETQWNWLWRKGGGLVDHRGAAREVTGYIRKITIAEERRPGNWRQFDEKDKKEKGKGAGRGAPAEVLAQTQTGVDPGTPNFFPASPAFGAVTPTGAFSEPTDAIFGSDHGMGYVDTAWRTETQVAKLKGTLMNKGLSIHLLECGSKILNHGLSMLLPEKLHIEGLASASPSAAFGKLKLGIQTDHLHQISFSKIELDATFLSHLLKFLPGLKAIADKTFRLILAYDADTSKYRTSRRPARFGRNQEANYKIVVWEPIPFLVFLEWLHKDAYLAQIKAVWIRRVVGKRLAEGHWFDEPGFHKLIEEQNGAGTFDKERAKLLTPAAQAFEDFAQFDMGLPEQVAQPEMASFLANCTNEYWMDEENRLPFVKWAAAKVYSYPSSFKGYVE